MNNNEYISVDFHQTWSCIDTVEICFGISNREILSIIDRVICPPYNGEGLLSFHFYIFQKVGFDI